MHPVYAFDFVLGRTEPLLQDPDPQADVRWAADETPQACASLARQAHDIAARLMQSLANLQRRPVDTADLPAMLGNAPDPEASIRRLHRFVQLQGTWECGWILIAVYDNVVAVELAIDAEQPGVDDLDEALARLLTRLEAATRFHFLDQEGRRELDPVSATSLLLTRHHRGLEANRRAARRSRWLRTLGVPSAILMTIVLGLLAFLIAKAAVEHGSLVLRTDPASETIFVTTALAPPVQRYGISSIYTLEGKIQGTNEYARLPVSRDTYIRAAPGARYTVLRTSDPSTPLVPQSAYDPTETIPRIGDHGVAWFVLLALVPVSLWVVLIAYPWLRARGDAREEMKKQMTRNLLSAIKLILLAGIAVVIRLLV